MLKSKRTVTWIKRNEQKTAKKNERTIKHANGQIRLTIKIINPINRSTKQILLKTNLITK